METTRRQLIFASFPEVFADLDLLLRVGYTKVGQWDLAQMCFHLAEWTRFPMDGFPKPPLLLRPLFWFLKLAFAKKMTRQILETGTMRERMMTVPDTVAAPGKDDREAVQNYRAVVDRLLSFEGPWQPSPLFGPTTKDSAQRFALLHAAHHLSFLIPNAG